MIHVLAGFAGMGLLAIAASGTAEAAEAVSPLVKPPDDSPPSPLWTPPPLNTTYNPNWKRGVLEHTVKSEGGGYGAQNKNWDGAGLSYGMIQWTQKHGNLGRLLRLMSRKDPAGFARIFGGSATASELLAVTNAPSESARLMPVAGANLWEEPWTSRFAAAARHAPFQAAQREMATTGDHWKGAVKALKILSAADGALATERSMALCFDTSVQQGQGEAPRIATDTVTALTQGAAVRTDYFWVLATYAQIACNRVRRLQVEKPREKGTWRQVAPGEWHKFIGSKFDYYEDYRRRRFGIVWSPELSDAPLPAGALVA